MMPSGVYEILSESLLDVYGITPDRIIESQSVDTRPFNDGYFITVAFEERLLSATSAIRRGPRTMTIAVHTPDETTRDYGPINVILSLVTEALSEVENYLGQDGMEISEIALTGESGNLVDEGYKTLTRFATYRVSYHEKAA